MCYIFTPTAFELQQVSHIDIKVANLYRPNALKSDVLDVFAEMLTLI